MYVVRTLLVLSGFLLHGAVGLQPQPTRPSRSMNLIEKRKWSWKEASEESKTEWGIVLKRYIMVDMALYELERHFDEAIPEKGVAVEEADIVAALGRSRTKLSKLKANLDRAVLDQNTTDSTAADMQVVRKGDQLTTAEKKLLDEEHKKEQLGFFSVLASAQDVYQQADMLQTVLEAAHNNTAKAPAASWQSIVAPPSAPTYSELVASMMPEAKKNATKAKNVSLASTVQSVSSMFQKYKAAAQSFHSDLSSFESMQKKAFTNLLSLHSVGRHAKKQPAKL
eukprot:TRINITY_DN84343_c0_g1_i1.p1 TRINITY_DN84343_c0_g1~~TRINITY_DN84343_c0_g1_i1.p1  ORF type:complete len:281 (+),score=106.50 TRINITY_DN84343_c0_g1_i1:47-889(+)